MNTSIARLGGGFEIAKPDGFRLDAVKHVPLSFWAKFNANFELMRLGEWLDGDATAVSQAWTAGRFTSMFDFPLAFAITDVFCRGESPAKLAAVLTNDRSYPDPSLLVTLVDNHDLPRLMSQCGGNIEKAKQALTFLMSMRGIPSLTWGTEVGLEGAHEPENRASMKFEEHPLRAHLASLMKHRALSVVLREGAAVPVFCDGSTLTIARIAPDGTTVHVTVKEGKVTVSDAPVSSPELVTQWRTGSRKRTVTLDGAGRVVGSGPELGNWDRAQSKPLPLKVELPEWGVFEFKRIIGGEWETGPNHFVFVNPKK